jgi:hypothetical protein
MAVHPDVGLDRALPDARMLGEGFQILERRRVGQPPAPPIIDAAVFRAESVFSGNREIFQEKQGGD